MISGGQHKNIFSVNLGQLSLDRDIKLLSNEIALLQKELAALTEGQGGDSQLNAVVKDTTRIETEIEIGKQKLTDLDRQIKQFKETTADQQTSLSKYEKDLGELDKQLATLNQAREELQNDLKEAETQAYAGFLKKIG